MRAFRCIQVWKVVADLVRGPALEYAGGRCRISYGFRGDHPHNCMNKEHVKILQKKMGVYLTETKT